jgi:murein DD-endopeptidase MepM/ murein hydrolase activator NlpD
LKDYICKHHLGGANLGNRTVVIQMKREKFVFNPHTLSYERFSKPLKNKLLTGFGYLSSVFFSGFIFFLFAQHFFPSPKEKMLNRELEQLKYQFTTLNQQLDVMASVVEDLHQKDVEVHRLIFGIESIDDDVWNAGTGGADRLQDIALYRNSGKLIKTTLDKTTRLEAQLNIQKNSLESLLEMANDRENYLASIPSIKPVQGVIREKNIPLLSGFGMRIHPVHKIARMHTGIDFTAPVGTPIRATGNGKVITVKKESSGYGHHVIIDHGYGFKTLYAHMSKIDAKEGQLVTKGQKIGAIGNTGTSTAPHLHYEVLIQDRPVNPIKYCMDGLTPEEYKELVDMSAVANKSFD